MMSMKTTRLLAENVSALLRRDGYNQHDLAVWCRKSDPWVTDFIKHQKGWKFDDLTRVADLFGLEPYHLLRPGIVEASERRAGRERRSDKDRRQAPAVRVMMRASQAIDAHRPPRREPNYAAARSSIRQLTAKFEQDAQRILAELSEDPRGQVARPGTAVPKAPARVRNPRQPDTGNPAEREHP